MIKEEKRRRNWRFIGAITIMSFMFLGVLLYVLIPPLLTRESLTMWSFRGWTVNSDGQIKQATFTLLNNGTRTLTVTDLWVNGTSINTGEWSGGSILIPTGSPSGTPGATGLDVLVTPKIWVFTMEASYNFTVGTASGNRYAFIVRCNETTVSPENLTIINWDFVPYGGQGFPAYIGVRYRNYGQTPIIITKVELDGLTYNITQWTWPGSLDSVIMDYDWSPGQTYTIIIRTSVGNAYRIVAAAPTEG